MMNRPGLFGFVLFVGVLLLAAASAAPAEQVKITSVAPMLELESEARAPLSPEYFPLSAESESPAADSLETEPESLLPLYPPSLSLSPAMETGSPPESISESSPREFPPVFSPAPEAEPADSDYSIPSTALTLPSMAPITCDDNDADPSFEPTASSPLLALDESNGDSTEETAENYSEQDNSGEISSLNHQSKGGKGVVFGVIAGMCLVGLGGFVYLRRRNDGVRRSKYNQYLALNKKEGV